MRTRNAFGIFSSDVAIGNLLWVDQVNGIDELAARGRMTIPFRTLTAAKKAAQSGDTIVVLPGTYGELNLAKDGVNWHFLNGAIVFPQGLGSTAIFDTYAVGSACTFKVTGNGVFKHTASGGGSIFNLVQSADNVTVDFDTMEALGNCVNSAATVKAAGRDMLSTGSPAVAIAGTGTNFFRVDTIKSTGDHGVLIWGDSSSCSVDISSFRISSTSGDGLSFVAGTAHVAVYEITSSSGYGVYYSNSYSHPLFLRAARIVSTWANTSGKALYINSGSGVRLSHCVLISHTSASYSIDGASGVAVNLQGQCAANKNANTTNVTLKPSSGALLVDGDFA